MSSFLHAEKQGEEEREREILSRVSRKYMTGKYMALRRAHRLKLWDPGASTPLEET